MKKILFFKFFYSNFFEIKKLRNFFRVRLLGKVTTTAEGEAPCGLILTFLFAQLNSKVETITF